MIPIIDPAEVSLYDFCTDEGLFGSINPRAETWLAWNTIFKVLSAHPLNKKEHVIFDKVSGGLEYRRGKMPKNLCGIIGRGGGKSFSISRIGQYRTLTFNYPLAPGQIPRNLIMSPNFRSGNETLSYVEGLFDEHEELKQYITGRTKTEQIAELRFSNRCRMSLMPVTRVSGRGVSTWTLILEEAGFFKTDGRFSDTEVFDSARPSMARFGMDSAFFIITTPPQEKEGLVWQFYNDYFGVRNDLVLVINGSCKVFNPNYPDAFIEQDLQRKGENYVKREYGAQFVDGESKAIPPDPVNACVLRGQDRIPFNSAFEYFGVLDPATLSGSSDELSDFAAGVYHVEERDEKKVTILDAILGWSADRLAPRQVTPNEAVSESIDLFREYGVSEVTSDQFAREWLKPKYEDAGLQFKKCDLNKWALYSELLPGIKNGEVFWVDNGIADKQIKSLEIKKGTGGIEKIDRPRGKKDDHANIVALGNYEGRKRATTGRASFTWVERSAPAQPSTVCACGADLERGGSINSSGKVYCGKPECAERVTT